MEKNFWEKFFHPPVDCTQSPFWFLNGAVNGEEYAAQMDEMAQQGVFQAMPHPRFGMDRREYLTPHYFNEFGKLLSNAAQNGYYVNLYDEYNWSSGTAGGRLTAEYTNCAQGIAIRTGHVSEVFECSEWEEGFFGWGKFEDILLIGYAPWISETEVNLSSCCYIKEWTMQDKTLRVMLPKGNWMVFVVYTVRTQHPSPLRQGNGGLVDYLNSEITQQFIELTHEQYYSHFSEHFGKTIPSIFYDEVSPNASGNFTWNVEFAEKFEIRNHYSIIEKLPLLFLDGGSETAKVRCDYWDTLMEIYRESFVGKLADWCHNHGIALTGHTHEEAGFWPVCGDIFNNLSAQQWVGLDSLNGYKPYSCLKAAVSAAHITGRKIVLCEALGLIGGWNCTPAMLKKAYNQLAIAGVNFLVPHSFYQDSENPKAECPPSFFKSNPYWRYYQELSKLTDRQCWVNRETIHAADVVVFYPVVSWWAAGRGGRGRTFPWSPGEEAAVITSPEYEEYNRILDDLMHHQIDYDVFNSQALSECTVHNGKIRLHEEEYQVLILPPMSTIRRSDAERLLELANEGVLIVAVGAFHPMASAELGSNDAKLIAILSKLEEKITRVRAAWELPVTISNKIETDIQVLQGDLQYLDVAHRWRKDIDFYLLSNTSAKEETFTISVRKQASYTILLDHNGRKIPILLKKQGNRTIVSFTALPEEFYYLILSCEQIPVEKSVLPDYLENGAVIELDKFQFTILPKMPNNPGNATIDQQVICIPTAKTTPLMYECPQGDDLAPIWDSWMNPDFDDSVWETISFKRGSHLYDHTGSRLFRFSIPAGTVAIRKPLPINGEYALYLNGNLLEAEIGFVSDEEIWMPLTGCEHEKGVLAIECSSMAPQFGLVHGLEVLIQNFETSLLDWRDLGIEWFSGFGVYQTTLDWKSGELWLNLGDVRYCAEVWVNGNFVGHSCWAPYQFNLTPFLSQGKNDLRIYCCNLISNEYAWDLLGSRGGGEMLSSGVLGPVQLCYKNKQ